MKSADQTIHYTIRVTGRVQGVFFRASTQETAVQLGIKGWVRNEKDGSVLIEAEGTEKQMKALIDWCRKGPKFSRVEQVHWEEKPIERYLDFSIKR